ncbi:MAG: hypothetical protein ACJ792_00430 [Gemmatimonadaceae bacterium]
MTLTFVQHALIRTALQHRTSLRLITREQRRAIRELCAHAGPVREPEQLLIAFKVALVEAANDERIPFGPERSELLGQLISVFIDELYKGEVGVDTIRETRSHARAMSSSSPTVSLENDSPASLL